ncbi:hypothetical protein AA14337_0757 [Acetobacter malorum DSM 14337]|uniref:Uncharacterized protein n=1 Tax=Acetobacter malorum DSM 14337 TaxID=1307910 RepID=A0ABQ0PP82_9PROT|nr:hypothetical protein AA14337_0757 [Acetobacter malorum DSM 14337]
MSCQRNLCIKIEGYAGCWLWGAFDLVEADQRDKDAGRINKLASRAVRAYVKILAFDNPRPATTTPPGAHKCDVDGEYGGYLWAR